MSLCRVMMSCSKLMRMLLCERITVAEWQYICLQCGAKTSLPKLRYSCTPLMAFAILHPANLLQLSIFLRAA